MRSLFGSREWLVCDSGEPCSDFVEEKDETKGAPSKNGVKFSVPPMTIEKFVRTFPQCEPFDKNGSVTY